jgi:hypothetical protein
MDENGLGDDERSPERSRGVGWIGRIGSDEASSAQSNGVGGVGMSAGIVTGGWSLKTCRWGDLGSKTC